jgi:rRNA-processing protein FCF1
LKFKISYVILDSNFILLPFQFRVDYLNEIRTNLEGIIKIIIYQQILNELEAKKIREPNAVKFQQHYNSGLLYLEKAKINYDIVIIEETKEKNENTDEFLVKEAIKLKSENSNVFLATNDSNLRRKAKQNKINTIFLRQKKFLAFDRI